MTLIDIPTKKSQNGKLVTTRLVQAGGSVGSKPKKETPLVEDKIIRIALADIEVDWTVNARNGGKPVDMNDPEMKRLMADIRNRGLLENLVVAETGKPPRYLLTAGFRRYVAVSALGYKFAHVRVMEGLSERDILLANGAENMIREDLTIYDYAARCVELKRKYKMTGVEIAEAWHVTGATISGYIRTYEGLHPKLLEAWRRHDESYSDMLKMASLPHDDQLERWEMTLKLRKSASEPDPIEDEEDPLEKEEKTTKLPKMRPRIDLEKAVQFDIPNAEDIKLPEGWMTMTDDDKKVAKAVIRWVMNKKRPMIFRSLAEESDEE